MIQRELAMKYSKAIFEYGKENDKLTVLKKDLKEVNKIVEESKEFNNLLFSVRILPEDKKNIIDSIFKDKISDYIRNFLKLLIDKRREVFLAQIIKEYNNKVDREMKTINVQVISAIKLSKQSEKELKDKLSSIYDSEIKLELKKDPSILGGMILKIGDQLIDGSIKNHLDGLTEKIEKIPVSELGV